MIRAKAAIFDLDCTLVDTLDRFFAVFNELMEKNGRRPLEWDEFFRQYVADTLDDVVAHKDAADREKVLHDFWMEFLWKYREGDIKCSAYPGVKELFEGLYEKKVPIAVITSCIVPSDKLRKELKRYGVASFVKAVVTAHDVVGDLEKGHHFSKAEIFKKVAKELGVDPKECVIVGDYWNDIQDGKKVGAKTVGVMTGLMRKELLEKYKPDAIINSVREIPTVVEFVK